MTSSGSKDSWAKVVPLLMWSGADVCLVIMWVFLSQVRMKAEPSGSITMRADYVSLLHYWLPSSVEHPRWQMLLTKMQHVTETVCITTVITKIKRHTLCQTKWGFPAGVQQHFFLYVLFISTGLHLQFFSVPRQRWPRHVLDAYRPL